MDDADIIRYIIETYPDTDVVTAGGGTFFSIDPEKHWPNFATLVTTDEFDEGPIANLSGRPGVFRLNIGVTGNTFDRVLGDAALEGAQVDFAALDTLLPHPVYGKQHWLQRAQPRRRDVRAAGQAPARRGPRDPGPAQGAGGGGAGAQGLSGRPGAGTPGGQLAGLASAAFRASSVSSSSDVWMTSPWYLRSAAIAMSALALLDLEEQRGLAGGPASPRPP